MQQSWQGTKRSEPLGPWRECLSPDTRVYSGSQRNWSIGAWESACSWGEMFNLSKENFCRNFFTSLSTSLPFCPSFWDGTFRKTYIYIKRNTKIFIFFFQKIYIWNFNYNSFTIFGYLFVGFCLFPRFSNTL